MHHPRPVLRSLPSIVAWMLVALVGLGCLAFVAFARGEEVSALWIVIASLCVFALAWRFHSAWLMAKVLTISDSRVTPAVRCEDGKDFVPSNKWVVFGHHFAAIAGPGPLVGHRERGALPAGRELSGGPVPGEGPSRGRDAGGDAKPGGWALRTGVGTRTDPSRFV